MDETSQADYISDMEENMLATHYFGAGMRAMKEYKVSERVSKVGGESEKWKTYCTAGGLGNISILAGGATR